MMPLALIYFKDVGEERPRASHSTEKALQYRRLAHRPFRSFPVVKKPKALSKRKKVRRVEV